MEPIEPGEVLPGSLAVRGHEAVYAVRAPDGQSANVKLYDARTGERVWIGLVPATGASARVESLDYDGRFVVWSDNRGGTLQVHVADPKNQTFTTLTRSQSDQRQVRVDNGIAVWASWGDFTIRGQNLREGGVFIVGGSTGVGPASSPDVHAGRISWSQADPDGHFQLRLTDLADGQARQLTDDAFVHSSPRLSDTRIAWLESSMPDGSRGSGGSRIVVMDLATREVLLRTDGWQVTGRPALSNDWLLWANASTLLDLHQFSTGHRASVPMGKVLDVSASDDLAAVIAETPQGPRLFAATPTEFGKAAGGSSPAPAGFLLLAGILLASVLYRSVRRPSS